jgi:hypothetical protein
MNRLEYLQPNASVRGILPDCFVTVVTVQWFGPEALELTYKDPAERVANELLCYIGTTRRGIEVLEQGRPWSFDGDGHLRGAAVALLPRVHTVLSLPVPFTPRRPAPWRHSLSGTSLPTCTGLCGSGRCSTGQP